MPEFHYTARDSTGKQIEGKRQAISPEDLANQLQKEMLIPLEITQGGRATKTKTPSSKEQRSLMDLFRPKIPQGELQMFCRQMYTLLKSGIPILIAVTRLSETTNDKQLAQVLQKVLASLNQGRTLSVALAQFPHLFSDFFINLVRVGENTGQLDIIFMHLSSYIELEEDTKKKIKTALRYPILVMVSALVAMLIINAFVVPAFAQLFKSFHGTLPLPTRILIGTSNIVINYWYVLLLGAIGSFLAFRYYIHTPNGRLKWAYFILKIPKIGWLIHRITLARFARLYALVLRSGITAVDGIELVGSSTGNAYIALKIKEVGGLIGRGNSIAKSVAQTQLFPTLVVQMITLGEESGNIDGLLDDVAEFYQREIDYDLVRLSDAIQPILLVIMGGMVLILALGVFLPIWDMASQIKH